MTYTHITRLAKTLMLALATVLVTACSTTRSIPNGDQLYTGLAKTKYKTPVQDKHFTNTQAEIDAALATAPNGALFGSSSVRSPFQVGLWVWNAFVGSNDGFSKWMLSSFGSRPVLLSWVNPALRASVAQEVLRAHGYFHGKVGYDIIKQHNPKKAKIKYTVDMGPLWTVDSLSYQGFPPQADSLIMATTAEARIRKGDAFDVNTLDAERRRVSTLLRNNGFFYYQPSYASWLVDSVSQPGKVLLKLQLAEQTPSVAERKWTIGKINIDLHKSYGDSLMNSETRRDITMRYNGKHSPLRVPVILSANRLFPRQLYNYSEYQAGISNLSSTGLFSTVDVNFSPRDTTGRADTLDMHMNLVFDKPYDIYLEGNVTGKTNNRIGPGAVLGITRRNAFRGGELLDLKIKGNYEWQTAHHGEGNASKFNSYEYGADVSLQLPRMVIPYVSYFRKKLFNHFRRIGFFSTPSTTLKFSYVYTYTSPKTYRNPLWWQTTVSESGNILSLGEMVAGNKWSKKNKELFKNPYAQFFKLETELVKTWQLTEHSSLVAHGDLGMLWAYGNSGEAPYSEQFYVGGANSIRAFTVRSIGPGSYHNAESATNNYLDQTGDLKFLGNLEYRPRLFGNLYGAMFLDAGNVWSLHKDDRSGGHFEPKNLLKEMALGTGVGLRYDMDFLVIRVDWGVGLHVPYKSGFYNVGSFRDSQSLHFAIGYPF